MTELTLYNSLTRKKEVFKPQDPKRVTMYNCGPTVYSYAHIGNARAAVVADVLFRVLRHIYGEDHVVYARNITDVDDKIIKAAKDMSEAEGRDVPISEITEKYARIYNKDLAALNCLPPTLQPKCTDHIPHMIEMIQGLIDKGFAYISDGHVFFDVSTYDDYGKLSGNTLENLRGGDRVGEGEVARKKNAADFVLWKPELDGVGWDAPFGPNQSNMRGRPGWHIECSAMAKATLGEVIDIHCGGVDLKFPHHENEIAQSCCGNDTDKFANYWVHNEFLNMAKKDGSSEKMAKSLGNVKLVRDLLKDWDGEVIRLALLKAHYRSELIWTEDLLKESKAQLDGWYKKLEAFKDLSLSESEFFVVNQSVTQLAESLVGSSKHSLSPLPSSIKTPLLNDLNLPHSLRYIGQIFEDPTNENDFDMHESKMAVWQFRKVYGLLQKDPDEWFKGGLDSERFNQLVKDYDAARADAIAAKKAGDKAKMGELFQKSDSIRDTLQSEGIVIETGSDGSSWRKA